MTLNPFKLNIKGTFVTKKTIHEICQITRIIYPCSADLEIVYTIPQSVTYTQVI